jgi:hypothetical protein
MPPRSKDGRLRLGEPLATELAALRAAIGMGATEIGVVRDAIRFFMAERLKNQELRKLFEAELERLYATKRAPIRLVTPETKD